MCGFSVHLWKQQSWPYFFYFYLYLRWKASTGYVISHFLNARISEYFVPFFLALADCFLVPSALLLRTNFQSLWENISGNGTKFVKCVMGISSLNLQEPHIQSFDLNGSKNKGLVQVTNNRVPYVANCHTLLWSLKFPRGSNDLFIPRRDNKCWYMNNRKKISQSRKTNTTLLCIFE